MFADAYQLSLSAPKALVLSLLSMGYSRLVCAHISLPLPTHSVTITTPIDSVNTLKQTYSIRKPVPKSLLRAMTTDRPDVTESAYSVDAGHFQVETDLIRLTRQRTNGLTSQEIDFNDINLKIGLNRTTDLELVVNSFQIHQESNPEMLHQSSFNAFTLRVKRNLWGNDGGRTALSLIPFIKLPIGSPSDHPKVWEGGLVTPFAWQLPQNWTFGSQLQATLNHDADHRAYYLQVAPTVTVGHDIYQHLGGFIELAAYWDVRQPRWQATLNGGPILRLSDNVQFDVGVNLALTPNTPSSYFLGFSFRH